MITLRKYFDVVKAEMDKSLLESAGIPAFVAGENSAAIGYGGIIGELRLQVDDADAERARETLRENQDATPLTDDFIPPETTPSETPRLEIAAPDSRRAVFSTLVILVFVFAMFATLTWWKTTHSASAYYRRGIAKWDKGDRDGALADFNRAIEVDSRHSYAYVARGYAKETKGDWDGAFADYDHAIAVDKADVYAYYDRGGAKRKRGDLDGALADYDRAIELNPQDASVYNDRGSTKLLKGDLSAALADFNKTIQLNPKDPKPYFHRGTVEARRGNLNEAILDYDRSIMLDSGDAKVYYGRGVAHYNKRDWTKALIDFRGVLGLNSSGSKSSSLQDYSQIRIWMIRAKLGERETATRELKQYLRTRQTGKPGDWSLTVIGFLTGDTPETDFLKSPDSVDEKQVQSRRSAALFCAGTVRLLDGDKTTAAEYFKKCLETSHAQSYEYQSAAAELANLNQ